MAGSSVLRPAVLSEKIPGRPGGDASGHRRGRGDGRTPFRRRVVVQSPRLGVPAVGPRRSAAAPDPRGARGHAGASPQCAHDGREHGPRLLLAAQLCRDAAGAGLVRLDRGHAVAGDEKTGAQIPGADGRSQPDRLQGSRFWLSRRQQRGIGRGGRRGPSAQLSRHRHLRRHRRRPRLLWRADGRLLHSRGRTFDHHRLGPQPRSRRDAEHVGAISPRHDRGGQRQLRRVPGLRQDLGADAARAGAGPRRLRSHSARLRRSRQRAGHRHAQRARDSGRPFRLHGQRQGLQGPQPARPSHPERRR